MLPGPNRVAPGLQPLAYNRTMGIVLWPYNTQGSIASTGRGLGPVGELMLKQKATFPDFLKMNNKQMPFSIELYILLKGTDTNFTKNSSDIRN